LTFASCTQIFCFTSHSNSHVSQPAQRVQRGSGGSAGLLCKRRYRVCWREPCHGYSTPCFPCRHRCEVHPRPSSKGEDLCSSIIKLSTCAHMRNRMNKASRPIMLYACIIGACTNKQRDVHDTWARQQPIWTAASTWPPKTKPLFLARRVYPPESYSPGWYSPGVFTRVVFTRRGGIHGGNHPQ
jgi:hypothetical protein